MILVCGDIIGVGPDSREVLELLDTIDHVAVKGNSDQRVVDAKDDPEETDHQILHVSSHIRHQLGGQWVDYVGSLPDHRIVDCLDERDVCMAHGMPGDYWKGVDWTGKRDTDENLEKKHTRMVSRSDLERMLNDVPSELFVTGHMHRQFRRLVQDKTVVNPGAVTGFGVKRAGQLLAEYAILDYLESSGAWRPVFRQVEFDWSAFLGRLESARRECEEFGWVVELYEGILARA